MYSPRTPIEGERSSTARTNALTESSQARLAPDSYGSGAWSPTPRTVTGMVSFSITLVSRWRYFSNDGRKALARVTT